jgi:hypothetical protein
MEPSINGGSANIAISPTGGKRRGLSAGTPPRLTENGTNAVATPAGEKTGPGIATITIRDEDAPEGALPSRRLASRTASEGCSTHSTDPANGWNPVETLHYKDEKVCHQKAASSEH